jgi:hypothetical protein
MKTSELIEALAADPSPQGPSLRASLALALALGAALSAAMFFATLGWRSDFAEAIHTVRFDLKFVDTLALLLPSAVLSLHVQRPDARLRSLALLLFAPVFLLVVAVIVEMAIVPPSQWRTLMLGENSLHCLSVIPLLAIAPLALLIYSMRSGAPRSPTLAGALAGAASAGIAATLYASNCPDDSPLFVVSWYPLATFIVIAVGALAGNRFLRW